jgi:microsomal prostaglandin-E synthase 2
MKPKLYQYTACPFCSKVASALAYKGVDYEAIEVHPLNKKEIEFSKDYRAVPIYIDSQGNQVNDSNTIMRHIDNEFPERRIFSLSETDKIKEDKWLAWSENYVQGLPTVIYDNLPNSLKAFDYITKTGKFSWIQSRTIKWSGALVMTLVAKKIKKRLSLADPKIFLRNAIHDWSEGLMGQDFMGGTEPNAADMAVYGISRSVAGLSAGKIFKENPVFHQWLVRMSEKTGLAL